MQNGELTQYLQANNQITWFATFPSTLCAGKCTLANGSSTYMRWEG